jgi:uncharacterized protein involved in exopolysaccharide biosynthesis
MLDQIRGIRNSISLRLTGGIITIHCERQGHRGAELAQGIVDHLTKAIISENLEVRQDQISGAMRLLESLLDQYKSHLDDAEVRMKDFDEIHQMDLTAGPAADVAAKMSGLEQQAAGPNALISHLLQVVSRQTDNEIKLKSFKDQRKALMAQIGREEKFKTTELRTGPSEILQQFKQRHAKAVAELAALRSGGATDKHPQVQEKLAEIRSYEDQIRRGDTSVTIEEKRTANPVVEQLALQISDLDARTAALQTEQEGVKKQTKELTERVKLIPAKQIEKAGLEREQSINANMYQAIRLRYENAKLTDTLEAADRVTRFSILNPPSLEPDPIRPHRKVVWVMGTFLGMVIGIVLSFVREFTDTSFRNLDDASRYLDLPVLGVIPEVNGSSTRSYRRSRRTQTPQTLRT